MIIQHDENWLKNIWSTRTTDDYNCGPDDCRAYHEHMMRWIQVDDSTAPDDGKHYQVKLSTGWSLFYKYHNNEWIDRWNVVQKDPVAWRYVTDDKT